MKTGTIRSSRNPIDAFSVALKTLRSVSLLLGVLAWGIGSANAQQTLPTQLQIALAEAANGGSHSLLDAVATAVEENPDLAQHILAEARLLDPTLPTEDLTRAMTARQTFRLAAAEESKPLGPGAVLAGAGGLVVIGGAVALAAGGGGGGGGDSGGGEDRPSPEPGPPGFETSEYRAQEGLSLVSASDAYARGGTGAGVVIAVLDTGLDVSHPEFQGQVAPGGYDFVRRSPVISDPHGHGTHVSGIAAARKNNTGMHGVAYNAKILPIRMFDETGFSPLTDSQMAAAIDHSINNGAMVINNSWGSSVPVTGTTREQILTQIPNETAAWGRAVANDAVVVFATGNDYSTQPTVRPGLPYHFPEYEKLWLAAMAVELDGGDPIYSNACGVAAAWCLAAPGGGLTPGNPGVFSTVPVAQGSYGRKSGTSMAAPHVAGAVAVLMELFPELTHDQIVARLLATANNSGIYSDSSIFGQGLLDLEAATRPVGDVVVLTGNSMTGPVHTLRNTRIELGPAFGDGLKRSLQGAKLAVFDAHRATFVVDLETFVHVNDGGADVGLLLERFQSDTQKVQLGHSSYLSLEVSNSWDGITQGTRTNEDSRLDSLSFTSALDETEATFSYNRHPAVHFGLHRNKDIDRSLVMSEDAFSPPYLSFATEGFNFATSSELADFGSLRFGAFLGQQDGENQSNNAFGGLGELAVPFADFGDISLQLGTVVEKDTMLGSRTEGAFDTTEMTTYFSGLTGKFQLTDSLSAVGSYHVGLSNPEPAGGSLFSDVSSIRSDAFSVGLVGDSAFSQGDRYGFVVNQPLRVRDAEATLSLAEGRTREGDVVKQNRTINLAPSGRELDFEAFYDTEIGEQSSLGASFMLRTEPGHVADADDEAIFLIKFSHKF